MKIFIAVAAATLFSANAGYCAASALGSLDMLAGTENISVPASGAPLRTMGTVTLAGDDKPTVPPGTGNFSQHPPHPAYWANTSCFYDNGNFRVLYSGRQFARDVDDNFKGAVCAGGRDVAGLYDGDDFIVFNGRTRAFEYRTVDDGYIGAKVVAGNGFAAMYDGDDFVIYNARTGKFDYRTVKDNVDDILLKSGPVVAALYDGDDFIVYNLRTGQFDYRTVADNVASPVLEIGTDIAAIYDGDDLTVYDQSNGRFNFMSVDDNYPGLVIAAGERVILAYDGDDVVSYCSATGTFNREGADDGAWAQVYTEQNYPGAGLGILVGNDFFTVDPVTCRIQKQQFQRN